MNVNRIHRRIAFSASCLLALTVFAGGPAGAARRPNPSTTTTTTTAPAPVTTVVPTTIATPASFSVRSNVPDDYQVQITPSTQLGDAELLSGATVGGPVIITVGDNGLVAFLRLVENTDYVFRYRNKIFIQSTGAFLYSPWVQFAFHTPTFNSLRPSSPQNLRVASRTATSVTVTWDAVPTAVRYDYSLNGGASVQSGVCSGAYCTPTDPLVVTIPRPAPGAPVTFSVTASRPPSQGCGAYCFPDNRFITSLPTTILVSN